ncbi:MAG: PepSY-associated TM helix domain-containing protein [Pseudomonadota bacterium]
MNRDRRVRIYDLHAWTGVTLGFFLFVVSFTGCLALFYHELQTWEDPARRIILPAEPAPIHDVLINWVEEKTEGKPVNFLRIEYPSEYEPYYVGRISFRDEEGQFINHHQHWHPETTEPVPERGDGLAVWLLDFHRDLMWPASLGGRTIGRALVGIAGIIMLLSIISGVVTHRKMLKELFTLRINRSIRLKWKDAHNILGLWGLPFYSMIAFTGAFLGIVALLLPIMGMLVVKGETEKLFAVVSGPEIEAVGVPAAMLSVDQIYQRRDIGNGYAPLDVIAGNWGDETATYQINYPADTALLPVEAITISAVSGESIPNNLFLEPTTTNNVISAITPLHYGTYGGIALKLLYLVLGLSLCALILLGMMVWLERCLHSPAGRQSEQFYQRMGRLTIGFTLGNVLASVAIFYTDKLYSGSEEARITWVGTTYFLAWFLAIVYAWYRDNPYHTIRQLLMVAGVGFALLPLLNGFTSNDFSLFMPTDGLTMWHWFDVGFFITGMLILLIAFYLPEKREALLTTPRGEAALGVSS